MIEKIKAYSVRYRIEQMYYGGQFGSKEWRWRPVTHQSVHSEVELAKARIAEMKRDGADPKHYGAFRIVEIKETIETETAIVYEEALKD